MVTLTPPAARSKLAAAVAAGHVDPRELGLIVAAVPRDGWKHFFDLQDGQPPAPGFNRGDTAYHFFQAPHRPHLPQVGPIRLLVEPLPVFDKPIIWAAGRGPDRIDPPAAPSWMTGPDFVPPPPPPQLYRPAANGHARPRPAVPPPAAEIVPARPVSELHEHEADPHRLARIYLDRHRKDGVPTLRFWRGDFYQWHDGAYTAVTREGIAAELAAVIRGQFVADARAALDEWDGKKPAEEPKPRSVTTKLVGDVLLALKGECLLPDHLTPPFWADRTPDDPDPAELVAFPNGLVSLPALAADPAARPLPPTPRLFTLTALGFAYDPAPPAQVGWSKFLASVWPADRESAGTLQEFMGYLLTQDTAQQKLLAMVGPPRSGKGTVNGVVRGLVGPGNVAGPTLNSLAGNFGLSPLLGKSVAVIDDARLSGRTDVAAVVERLLTIVGEGVLTIDRKHREPVTAKLPTRFIVSTNELPRLTDASGALIRRMLVLRFTRSFVGHEDHALAAKLTAELPGIFRWAVEGWKRLRDRGRFVQPAAGAELVRELDDLASPVGAFVRECCQTGAGLSAPVDDLWAAWVAWCERNGKRETGTRQTFGRDLRAVLPELEDGQAREPGTGKRFRLYRGVRLRGPADRVTEDAEPRDTDIPI